MGWGHHRRRARRGGALLTSIMFVVVTSMLIVGMLTVSVSYLARAKTESDYENALGFAEAGVNYELRSISNSASNADQLTNGAGVTYTLGSGSFSVYCENKDGTTPWTTGSSTLYVVSAGTIHGVTRTVRVSAKGGNGSSIYAVYAINQGTFSGGLTRINGNTATDGYFAPSGGAAINGSVEFDGTGTTGWNGSYTTGSPITTMPNPVVWPTVTSLANAAYPSGGLTYLATHNDNALSPAISNNKLTVSGGGSATLYGQAGGANYYLTDVDISGGSTVNFDNSAGPITIWMGPSGGNGHSTFSGGSANVKNDPNKAVRIYSALKTTFTLSGGSEFDGGIYVYDYASNKYIGDFVDSGGSNLQGTVLANTMTVSGGSSINSTTIPYFNTGAQSYYGFDDQWLELNPL